MKEMREERNAGSENLTEWNRLKWKRIEQKRNKERKEKQGRNKHQTLETAAEQWFDLWLLPEANKVVVHPVPAGLQKSELSEGAAELPGKQIMLIKTTLSSVKHFFLIINGFWETRDFSFFFVLSFFFFFFLSLSFSTEKSIWRHLTWHYHF